jgi:tungstate transport system substrate-binding protein
MMSRLADAYHRDTGRRVTVIGESTQQVLELGRRGEADVTISHDPAQEADLRRQGLVERYQPLFTSRFVVVGPPELAVELAGSTPLEALRRIAERGWPFVSRGDGSGTHAAELELWSEAGIDPASLDGYDSTGQGMGLTLLVADQRDAFTLAEEATLLSADSLSLVPVSDIGLPNPYHASLIRGGDGEPFLAWLRSERGRLEIRAANEALFGRQVFATP